MSILDNIKNLFGQDKKETNPTPAHPDPGETQNLSPHQYKSLMEAERKAKDHQLKHSPHGPIEDRQTFTGLNYYPPNLAYRYILPLQPAVQAEPLTFQTSTGDERTYYRLGTVAFAVEGEPASLAIYKPADHDDLFLPFRDASSGQETYGAGRYLEPVELDGGNLLLDFNLAYNPFCAYSEQYSCPLPPFENHLKVPIRAGEKKFDKEH